MADERVSYCQSIGIDLYMDVMHFGTPTWLAQAAGDPEFPEALEAFSRALVTRYRSSIRTWCPCNEPLVLALFSGDFGFWPPHSRKWRGYMPVLSRIVQAVSRSIRAIRSAQPEATVLLCDNVENYQARDPGLDLEVRRRNLRRFLVLDLLAGKLDRHHPLYNWVTGYGISEIDLEWFRTHPQTPDVLGLDYYPNSDWYLEKHAGAISQRRAESPAGVYGIASAYYRRYGLPMMLTETSIDGKPINREIWLDETLEDCRRLRAEGIPLLGYFWWPLVDQVDWDGALLHRVGKIHEVGLFSLHRQPDGTLQRRATPLVRRFKEIIQQASEVVGDLDDIAVPAEEEDQGPPIGFEMPSPQLQATPVMIETAVDMHANNHLNANSAGQRTASTPEQVIAKNGESARALDRYGIVVFSHLRWGFVWQRPQQFLSRFARKHPILFVEEPFFDLGAGDESRLEFHKVMPNVTVIAAHFPAALRTDSSLPEQLREMTRQGIAALNGDGKFDMPLLWYYSPMDSAWSLGHFANRGIAYDCMDELSQFTGAPPALVRNEQRLLRYADVVFAGGLELGDSKKKQHPNVHTFGCGVDFDHFASAQDLATTIPPDIDFMSRPILGWFGVIDERVDYGMIGEMARMRPHWSFAMVGPVVKVDPNSLPHSPNLFWLGGRDYQQLPHYCRAFDVCIMPFSMNAATQFINPTKGLEYMATGRPIVGTPVRDVVRQWSDIVRIASTADEFVAAVEAALAAGPDDLRIKKGISLAKASAWDNTVSQLQQLIKDAINVEDRRSASAIAPLASDELVQAYQSTQGS